MIKGRFTVTTHGSKGKGTQDFVINIVIPFWWCHGMVPVRVFASSSSVVVVVGGGEGRMGQFQESMGQQLSLQSIIFQR